MPGKRCKHPPDKRHTGYYGKDCKLTGEFCTDCGEMVKTDEQLMAEWLPRRRKSKGGDAT